MRRASQTLTSFFGITSVLIGFLCQASNAFSTWDDEEPVIGIDFGSAYARVAVQVTDGEVQVIPDAKGRTSTPAQICIGQDYILAGGDSKDPRCSDPMRIVHKLRRRLEGVREPSPGFGPRREGETERVVVEVKGQESISAVVAGDDGSSATSSASMTGQDNSFTPTELVALLFRELKSAAEAFIGVPVSRAVISIPRNATDSYRLALRSAAHVAGLEVLSLITEGSAALIAHGFHLPQDHLDGVRNILVYNLGSSFTVSVYEVEAGVFDELAALTHTMTRDLHVGNGVFGGPGENGGVGGIGGLMLDERVVEWLVREYEGETGRSLLQDLHDLHDLRGGERKLEGGGKARSIWDTVEAAKIILSRSDEVIIGLALNAGGTFTRRLTRAKFEDLNRDLFEETIRLVEEALDEAGVERSDVHDVIFSGGSSNIPKIQDLLRTHFPQSTLHPHVDVANEAGVEADFVVVRGAARRAGELMMGIPEMYYVQSISQMSVGIDIGEGIFWTVFQRNHVLPGRRSTSFVLKKESKTLDFFVGYGPYTNGSTFIGSLALPPISVSEVGSLREISMEIDVAVNETVHIAVTPFDINTTITVTLQYPEGAPLSDSEIIKLVDASVAYEQEHAEARWELSDAIDSLLRGADYVAGLRSLGPSAEVSLAQDVIDIIEEAKEMKLWLEKRPWARREDIRDKLDRCRKLRGSMGLFS